MSSEDEDIAMAPLAPLAPPPSLHSQHSQPSPSVGSLRSIKNVYGRASMRASPPAMAQLSSPHRQKQKQQQQQLHLPRSPLERQRSSMRSASEATTNSRSTAADGTPGGDFSPSQLCTPTSETRIVAPNVDKLSPSSVVEICLASEAEHVKVCLMLSERAVLQRAEEVGHELKLRVNHHRCRHEPLRAAPTRAPGCPRWLAPAGGSPPRSPTLLTASDHELALCACCACLHAC